jgi:hypothetical protein
VRREKSKSALEAWAEGQEKGARPASRRLSRIIGPERTFVLPLLRRGRTLSNIVRIRRDILRTWVSGCHVSNWPFANHRSQPGPLAGQLGPKKMSA